jgi:hypothetical protein
MAFSNIALTDTFDTWRTRTNQLVLVGNDLTEGFFKKSTGTIEINNSGFANSNVSLNVSNGYIKGNAAGLTFLPNTSINGKIINSQLANSTIKITSNSTSLLVEGPSATDIALGNTVYLNLSVSNTVTNQSATNLAAAGSVNTVHSLLQTANADIRSILTGTITNAAASFGFANGVSTNTTAAFARANASLGNTASAIGVYVGANVSFTANGTQSQPVITRFGTGNTSTGIFFPSTGTIAMGASANLGVFVNTTGNVGIGTQTSSYKLYVQGDIYATGDITAFSDIAIKEDISTIENALSTVANLRGVKYTRKDTKERKIGLIAQEVQSILPEVVVNADNNIGVSYQTVVALLIEAVKELSNKVKILEGK